MEICIFSRNKRGKCRTNICRIIVGIFLFLLWMPSGQAKIDELTGKGNLINVSSSENEVFEENGTSFIKPTIEVQYSIKVLTLSVNESENITYKVINADGVKTIDLFFIYSAPGIISLVPNVTILAENITTTYQLYLNAISCGHTIMSTNASPEAMVDVTKAYVLISVRYSSILDYLSDVIGWFYFLAWSVSFYPQIILNCKRKSVIGLHFDFLAMNTIGFLLYSIFNIGFYWIPEIMEEYFKLHPHGINPVQLNDVIFSILAFVACSAQVIQCFMYDRGDQKISSTAQSLLGMFSISCIIALILSSVAAISWISFLYFLSYIKLFITLIKYIPQAYYNYVRKSTSGWSIGNIILDFLGGSLSIMQMFILAYNYDDWSSIFGDPTKFGLGAVSIFFDIFFMFQHYVWYKNHNNYENIVEPINESQQSSNASLHSSTSAQYGAA